MQIRAESTAAIARVLEAASVALSAREILGSATAGSPRVKLDIGSLYDVLGRCERDGWLTMSWRARPRGKGVKGPKREQVYALTPDGRLCLIAELTEYAQRSEALDVAVYPGIANVGRQARS